LPTIAANSCDSVVTDPPYGLSKEPDIAEVLTHWLAGDTYEHKGGGFMGKSWDSFVPGPEYWREVYRVLKPGGYLVCFAGTRTEDLMGISLRLAGFRRVDLLAYMFGSGFPKALNLSKEFDRLAGAQREVIGPRVRVDGKSPGKAGSGNGIYEGFKDLPTDITAPATDLARQWDGWHTALKPGMEPIILAQKALEKGLGYAQNVAKWGVGGLNIDATRIEGGSTMRSNRAEMGCHGGNLASEYTTGSDLGRWPANVILDDDAGALLDAMSGERPSGAWDGKRSAAKFSGVYNPLQGQQESPKAADTGGASRFFLNVSFTDQDTLNVVQYDGNSQTTGSEEWAGTDQNQSTPAASDIPPRRAITDSPSGTANEAAQSWPTSSNGSDTTEQSPLATRSTISISTNKTTPSPTSNSLTPSPTSDCTAGANCAMGDGGSPVPSAESASQSPPSIGTSETACPCMGAADPATSIKSLPINSGDALRFCYCAKASTRERSLGLPPGQKSHHPTVKPIALMRWLVRLVTPEGGTVLDPFAGSGTTLCAAIYEGRSVIGIEMTEDYLPLIRGRAAHAEREVARRAQQLALPA
jgi:DNA modification methylase